MASGSTWFSDGDESQPDIVKNILALKVLISIGGKYFFSGACDGEIIFGGRNGCKSFFTRQIFKVRHVIFGGRNVLFSHFPMHKILIIASAHSRRIYLFRVTLKAK